MIFRRLSFLLLVLLAVPAFALDEIYLVRHAEKADFWPADRELDTFQPLSARRSRSRRKPRGASDAGQIAAIYTSRTTRTLETGAPLAHAAHVPISIDDASIHPDEMNAFLARLLAKHTTDRALLIVGDSNNTPELLVHLGAKAECFQSLGITGQPGSLLVEGYARIWKVDLKKQGCEAMSRMPQASNAPW